LWQKEHSHKKAQKVTKKRNLEQAKQKKFDQLLIFLRFLRLLAAIPQPPTSTAFSARHEHHARVI
jgi:hypothetical protein